MVKDLESKEARPRSKLPCLKVAATVCPGECRGSMSSSAIPSLRGRLYQDDQLYTLANMGAERGNDATAPPQKR